MTHVQSPLLLSRIATDSATQESIETSMAFQESKTNHNSALVFTCTCIATVEQLEHSYCTHTHTTVYLACACTPRQCVGTPKPIHVQLHHKENYYANQQCQPTYFLVLESTLFFTNILVH